MKNIWLTLGKGTALGLLGFTAGAFAMDTGGPVAANLLSTSGMSGFAAAERNSCNPSVSTKEGKSDYVYFVSCGGFF